MTERKRDYLITINNPLDHDLDRETLADICNGLDPVYYCMSDEIGLENQTPHTHIYLTFKNARSFNSIQKAFRKVAHIDPCYGSPQENRDYVFKEGKWLDDEKSDTNLRDTHFEYGDLPLRQQGKRNDCIRILEQVKEGASNLEIISENPQLWQKIPQMERYRGEVMQSVYKHKKRDMTVYYIYGESRTGKTTYAYELCEKLGMDVCRINDYDHPFDTYQYEPAIIFDEYRSQIPISQMLTYLEGHPCVLPCRYANKQACYRLVIVISNIPLDQQYEGADYRIDQKTHDAFWNRFTAMMEFRNDERRVFLGKENFRTGPDQQYILLEEYERSLPYEKISDMD